MNHLRCFSSYAKSQYTTGIFESSIKYIDVFHLRLLAARKSMMHWRCFVLLSMSVNSFRIRFVNLLFRATFPLHDCRSDVPLPAFLLHNCMKYDLNLNWESHPHQISIIRLRYFLLDASNFRREAGIRYFFSLHSRFTSCIDELFSCYIHSDRVSQIRFCISNFGGPRGKYEMLIYEEYRRNTISLKFDWLRDANAVMRPFNSSK